MAHEWEDIEGELPISEQLSSHGARRCKKCGAVQKKESKHLWMRVTGYSWEPKVGRCPADKKMEKS